MPQPPEHNAIDGPVTLQHLLISGRVQGVGYRYSLFHQAQEAGLSGWCRNLADGRVEAVIQGPPDQVEQLIAWCHEGPRHAQVDAVQVVALPADDTNPDWGPGFEIRP